MVLVGAEGTQAIAFKQGAAVSDDAVGAGGRHIDSVASVLEQRRIQVDTFGTHSHQLDYQFIVFQATISGLAGIASM
jgi:hypothetical protein